MWHTVELARDDGLGFTGGERLFKLHDAVVGQLRDRGHRYFEGLELSGATTDGVSIYSLGLES